MREKLKIKVGEEFKPAPQLKKCYYIYLIIGILFGVLPWYIPVLLFAPFAVALGVLLLILATLAFIAYWIPKYYETMIYKLTQDEIVWKRGVWFKNTGIVPYNKITDIHISHGPISRKLGIATLKIQTAGYSGAAGAEISIVGVEQFEELRELIMGFVRGKQPAAVEAREKENIDLKILEELIKIRKLLEKTSE
jgi:hypothetical protein